MLNRRSVIGLGLIAVAHLGLAESAKAQRVSADIHIGGGPVVGTVRIEDRDYPRPRAYDRGYPRRLYIERVHRWDNRRYRNAKVVVVYYDRDCDLYFDGRRRGLEEVRVYRDGDRYYRVDDRDNRRDRRDRDRDWDRRDRDRRDDRNDRDKDDRWEHEHRH